MRILLETFYLFTMGLMILIGVALFFNGIFTPDPSQVLVSFAFLFCAWYLSYTMDINYD